MEIITSAVTFALLGALLLTPFAILKRQNKPETGYNFCRYLILGTFASALLCMLIGWWGDESTILLLKHYDAYDINPDSNSGQVYYDKVSAANLEKVKSLEKSHMGIGWPLKSIVLFVLSCAYLFAANLFRFLFLSRLKNKIAGSSAASSR